MRTILKVAGVKKLSNISKDFTKRYPNLGLMFLPESDYENGISSAEPFGKSGTHLRFFKINDIKPYSGSYSFSDISKGRCNFEIELDDYIGDSRLEDIFLLDNDTEVAVGITFNNLPEYVHVRRTGNMSFEDMNKLVF